MSVLVAVFVWALIFVLAASAAIVTLACIIEIRVQARCRRSERKAVRLIGPRAGDPATAGQEFRAGPRSWELNEDGIEFLHHAGVRAR